MDGNAKLKEIKEALAEYNAAFSAAAQSLGDDKAFKRFQKAQKKATLVVTQHQGFLFDCACVLQRIANDSERIANGADGSILLADAKKLFTEDIDAVETK